MFAVWASLGRTAPPKAVRITATARDGVPKGGACAGGGSLDQIAASVRRGGPEPTVTSVSQTVKDIVLIE